MFSDEIVTVNFTILSLGMHIYIYTPTHTHTSTRILLNNYSFLKDL